MRELYSGHSNDELVAQLAKDLQQLRKHMSNISSVFQIGILGNPFEVLAHFSIYCVNLMELCVNTAFVFVCTCFASSLPISFNIINRVVEEDLKRLDGDISQLFDSILLDFERQSQRCTSCRGNANSSSTFPPILTFVTWVDNHHDCTEAIDFRQKISMFGKTYLLIARVYSTTRSGTHFHAVFRSKREIHKFNDLYGKTEPSTSSRLFGRNKLTSLVLYVEQDWSQLEPLVV